jgi:dTDP-4-dehydrorhamnose 3,5-epimerase
MKFHEIPLAGAFIIEAEVHQDHRGFFGRTFCQKELRAAGLFEHIAQCSVSHNLQRGTLRGLHFQREPHAEDKIVSCTRGAIFDVIVDLRPNSPTFGRHFGKELTAESPLSLYVPKGCAHGFQTLTANATVFYMMSTFYVPETSAGIRWNDPDLGIHWPIDERILSERDANLPTLSEWIGRSVSPPA